MSYKNTPSLYHAVVILFSRCACDFWYIKHSHQLYRVCNTQLTILISCVKHRFFISLLLLLLLWNSERVIKIRLRPKISHIKLNWLAIICIWVACQFFFLMDLHRYTHFLLLFAIFSSSFASSRVYRVEIGWTLFSNCPTKMYAICTPFNCTEIMLIAQ